MDIVWDIVSKCNMIVDINVDIVWDVRHINGRFMRYQWDEKSEISWNSDGILDILRCHQTWQDMASWEISELA